MFGFGYAVFGFGYAVFGFGYAVFGSGYAVFGFGYAVLFSFGVAYLLLVYGDKYFCQFYFKGAE